MSKDNGGETVLIPESGEPGFPVNITCWRHYTTMRLLCMVILACAVFSFLETAYITTVRISEIRAEARAAVCGRGRVGRYVDNAARYWWGRPTENRLVELKTAQIVSRRRLRCAFKVFIAWFLVYLVFSRGAVKNR